MKISDVFAKAQKDKKKIFIPYITAGDPSLEATGKFLLSLQNSGADIIEVGVPFSDPVADGPTIQRATDRALKNGTNLEKILTLIETMRNEKTLTVPLVLFTYFNPIFKMGLEKFCGLAQRAQIQGLLVVDLPPEEATELTSIMARSQIETIFLSSPTTSPERLKRVDDLSTGFVYYVSRLGVTGAQNSVSDSLAEEIKRVRTIVKKPIAIGFGISDTQQAKTVSQYGDGVVVGSRLMEIIEKSKSVEDGVSQIAAFTKSIKANI